MTTPLGHSLSALIVWLTSPPGRRKGLILLALLAFAALLPDFDYFPAIWGDLELANLNHQGFSHSLLFAALSSVALAYVAKWLGCGPVLRVYPLVLVASLSHLLLDYLTYDGREPVGVVLLWPFSNARFYSPVTIFGGVTKGNFSDFFSLHNLRVIGLELLILAPLAILVWIVVKRVAESLPSNRDS
jgi:inner membrane protein